MIKIDKTNLNDEMIITQPSDTQMMVLLQHGHIAPQSFYNDIRDLILDQIPAIKPNQVVKLEDFYDPEVWHRMDVEERKLAGRCMSQMVIYGILPLEFVGCKHSFPNEYRLKQSTKIDNNCVQHLTQG